MIRMYFKIALGNIKKSYKDYMIYFLTLILGVCIFYSFNSIDSQQVFINVKSSDAEYLIRIIELISGISLFISVILGSLILYANNFLIKKRKKEFGIYRILGMSKRKVSRILLTETFIVGIISLVAGVILGMGVSQLLSIFTLKLFDVEMNKYRFTISINSISKTILYFGIMFLLVAIFNVLVISKYKIINLLTADKKSENVKFKKNFIYVLSFVLCVVCLIYSYKSLLTTSIDTKNIMFKVAVGILILGTVLFFFSLSGLVLYFTNKNKRMINCNNKLN